MQLDTFLKAAAVEATALTTLPETAKSKAAKTAAGDKKRKAPRASQGVESLKKVNVNGIAKLSSFFKKKAEKVPS